MRRRHLCLGWTLMLAAAATPLAAAAAGTAKKPAPKAPPKAPPAAKHIKITRPAPRGGGPDQVEVIAGEVMGVTFSDLKVVVFARTDQWYVQPYVGNSDTSIGSDGKWETDTHLGVEYAAVLAKRSYRPPATTGALPKIGGEIIDIATATAR